MHETVLLTGSTGFLGSRLLYRLAASGHRVIAMKRASSDLSRIMPLPPGVELFDLDGAPLGKAFEGNNVRTIIHCATNYGRRPVPASEVVEANLILPLKLLHLAGSHRVHSFINTDTILDKRVSHYSLSKKQLVDWLEHFSGGMVCCNVSLEHFYGPFDDPSKFVMGIILDLLNGVEQIDLTAGEQRRDFIYIDDVVDAFMKIIEFSRLAAPALHRFEVGTNQQIAIKEFVLLAREITGNRSTRLNFGALPYRRHEVMESQVDTKALRELGWLPRVALSEGLARTIDVERGRQRL